MTYERAAEGIEVFFGKTEKGNWVAATCSAPYFFVEVETEVDAHACANEAIRLYSENRDKISTESSPNKGQAEHLSSSLTDVTSELLYA